MAMTCSGRDSWRRLPARSGDLADDTPRPAKAQAQRDQRRNSAGHGCQVARGTAAFAHSRLYTLIPPMKLRLWPRHGGGCAKQLRSPTGITRIVPSHCTADSYPTRAVDTHGTAPRQRALTCLYRDAQQRQVQGQQTASSRHRHRRSRHPMQATVLPRRQPCVPPSFKPIVQSRHPSSRMSTRAATNGSRRVSLELPSIMPPLAVKVGRNDRARVHARQVCVRLTSIAIML